MPLSRRLSIDVLVSQLNQIVRVNHIGLLVIDELQNINPIIKVMAVYAF